MTTTEDHDDLPEWIRPGAKLARLGHQGYTMVTVKRITRTQIVTVADNNPDADYRFDRTPVKREHLGKAPEYRLRGSYSDHLVRRDHPDIVEMRINRIALNAAYQVDKLDEAYRNSARDDKRSTGERAIDLIDGIENAARVARRKVEALLNPSTLANAQYAQDLEA